MSRGVTFVRMYATDWRSGCLGLSLEQEGLYIRMCMFIAETGRRVPLDDTEASRMLNVQTRNYRRVLGELLRLGKVIRHDDGYGNTRIEHERKEAERASHRERPAKAAEGADRQADQGQDGSDHAASVEHNADITPIYSRSNFVTTELAAEIHQQNQRPSIEPVVSKGKKDTPLPPKGGCDPVELYEAIVATKPKKSASPDPREILAAFQAYNARALELGLPQSSKLTPAWSRGIGRCLREWGSDGWAKALANLDTPFLRGLTNRNFRADLKFLIGAENFAKLHDGGFAPSPHGAVHASDRRAPAARSLTVRERAIAAAQRGLENASAHWARSGGSS
jgi:uncharacterized protein YdaU (DUF1376 family)